MAWTERLKSGKYRGCWYRPDGSKDRTRTSTHPEHPFALKSDALHAAQEGEVRARRSAAAATGTLSAKLTWGAWWDQIAEDRAKVVSDTDIADRYIVRGYLRPHWGHKPLNTITQKQVKKWVDSLTDGSCEEWTRSSPPEASYVRRIYATFKASIQKAVDDEVLTATPCTNITLPKIRKKRKQHLTTREAERLGARLRGDYRDAVDLILETGLRPSELCGLHADHVDLDRNVIEVDMVHVTRRRVIRAWPKDKDAREVPLTRAAADIIRRRLGDRDLTAGCGVTHVDGGTCRSVLVFLTDRGEPMNAQSLGDRVRYAADAHAMPRRTPYAGRRGFATRAARGGMDAFAIAAVMGHADVDQTQEYVQSAHMGSVLRAALGDPDPLQVVDGGVDASEDRGQDGLRDAR